MANSPDPNPFAPVLEPPRLENIQKSVEGISPKPSDKLGLPSVGSVDWLAQQLEPCLRWFVSLHRSFSSDSEHPLEQGTHDKGVGLHSP